MCPACVIGVAFLAQLLGFGRWFRRYVLRKPVPDEEVYWNPKGLLNPKMKAFAANPRKMILTYSVIAAEIICAILIFRHVGFMFFHKLWMVLQ